MSARWLQAWCCRLLLAAAGLLPATGPAAAAELRVAVSRGPVSLPLYVAEANGYFAAEGLTVRQQDCSSGRECFQQLEAGSADLATSAELIVALDSLTAASATVVAVLSSSAQQIKLVARRSAGIAVPADLRGKRVGTVARTSAQYFLDNWLLYHDIAAAEVQIVPMAVSQLADGLAGRQLDAIVIWEPIASAAAARLGGDVARLAAPRVYTQHFVLSMKRNALPARDDDVQRLLRALLRAELFIAAQPQDAAAVLATRMQLDRAAARNAMAEHDYRLELTPTLLSTMDGQARWAIRERLVQTQLTPGAVLGAISPGPLRKAAPRAVSLPQR